jgi:hypothetical protein
LLDDFWATVTNDPAIVLSLLSLLVSIVALWLSLQRLRVARERLRVGREGLRTAEESLHLQERQLSFGRDFAKGSPITDGSLRLDFLQAIFIGPENDEHRLLARLMQQSAVEARITIENNSSSDALVQDLYVVPRFRPSMRKQSWFEKSWLARYVLHVRPRDSGVHISLGEHGIISINGLVGEEWLELTSGFDYFRGRYLWHAAIYDINTDAQVSFTEPIMIPHGEGKRIWKLELSIDPEFYRTLLKRGFFLSGVTLVMVTDLGNLEASYDYDTPGMLL